MDGGERKVLKEVPRGPENFESSSWACHFWEYLLPQDFVSMCEAWRSQLGEDLNILASEAHDGEFAAFISYALAFPKGFIALIDTYDVTRWALL